MHFLCLCPTYGRRVELLNNTIACFAAQTHPYKSLLLYDDLGTLQGVSSKLANVYIWSTMQRAKNLPSKYNDMVTLADASYATYDAVCVWDDDDVYLPDYLASHAEVLQQHAWSKPSRIISAYSNPPAEEEAYGRFHGSIAITRDLAHQVRWPDNLRMEYDQEYMQLLTQAAPPGDPCLQRYPPQYVYRWQTSQSIHCSGRAGDPNWYANYEPQSRERIEKLAPIFDADTQAIYRRFASATC